MHSVKFYQEQIVRAGHYSYLKFQPPEEAQKFRASINAGVWETGKDLLFFVMIVEDFEKWAYWKAHQRIQKTDAYGNLVTNSNGYPVYVSVPEPLTKKFVNYRSSVFKETLDLDRGEYVLVFDNTYSSITDKTVQVDLLFQWDLKNPEKDLPIASLMESDIPQEVLSLIKKANDCYVSGHFVQSSVMLRKGVERAIRLKLLQSGLNDKELFDSEGNELTLARKIEVLRKNFLITQKHSKDLDNVKWFGDVGAHGDMEIVLEDIRDNVEPKLRSFLMALDLKSQTSL